MQLLNCSSSELKTTIEFMSGEKADIKPAKTPLKFSHHHSVAKFTSGTSNFS